MNQPAGPTSATTPIVLWDNRDKEESLPAMRSHPSDLADLGDCGRLALAVAAGGWGEFLGIENWGCRGGRATMGWVSPLGPADPARRP